MKPRIVSCPHCGTGVVWDTANRWRPFCSERCKMVDLGAWASESYRIPVAETPDGIEDDSESGTDNPPLN